MLNTVQSNLVIVGGKDVYWKGALVPNVQHVFLHRGKRINRMVLVIENPDPMVTAELRAAGIIIKETE